MYQPKVNNTQKHSDSQGEHIVTEGKLLILSTGKTPEVGKLAKNTTGVYNIPKTEEDCIKSKGWFGNFLVRPIIISETEEIEVGDLVYNEPFGIHVYNEEDTQGYNSFELYKILALPEQFSGKHLQAIVDGKMKEGEVLVKVWFDYTTKIDLDQQNHVTLFPAKQSLEEAFCKEYNLKTPDKDLGLYDLNPWKVAQWAAEWAKKNNY